MSKTTAPDRVSPLDAIRMVRQLTHAPGGEIIPSRPKATLLALATYWPNIFPSLETLARDLGVGRASVGRWLHELEELGLVVTEHRGRGAERTLVLPGLQATSLNRETSHAPRASEPTSPTSLNRETSPPPWRAVESQP